MGTKDWARTVIFIVLYTGIIAKQCEVVPKCTCKFGDDTVVVKEQYTGAEALTGAVGALGSMIVTGGGFGIWYLIKRRKLNSVSSDTLNSSDSDVTPIRNTKSYDNSGFDAERRPPNIYTASRRDKHMHNVGRKAAGQRNINNY